MLSLLVEGEHEAAGGAVELSLVVVGGVREAVGGMAVLPGEASVGGLVGTGLLSKPSNLASCEPPLACWGRVNKGLDEGVADAEEVRDFSPPPSSLPSVPASL